MVLTPTPATVFGNFAQNVARYNLPRVTRFPSQSVFSNQIKMSYAASFGHSPSPGSDTVVTKTHAGVTYRVYTPEALVLMTEVIMPLPMGLGDGEMTLPVPSSYMDEALPVGVALLVPKRDHPSFGSSSDWVKKHISAGYGLIGTDGKAGEFKIENLPADKLAIIESLPSPPKKFIIPTKDIALVGRLSDKDSQAVVLAEPSGGWESGSGKDTSTDGGVWPVIMTVGGIVAVLWVASEALKTFSPKRSRR